jgi:hypothetical protein
MAHERDPRTERVLPRAEETLGQKVVVEDEPDTSVNEVGPSIVEEQPAEKPKRKRRAKKAKS